MTNLIDLSGKERPLDVLRKGRWARHVILDAVATAFAAGDSLTRQYGVNRSVWSASEVFIGQRSTLDLDRGIFEIEWRSPVLRLSLALRLGEVRIGIIIPRYSAITNLVQIAEDESYPQGGRGCERVVRDLGGQFVLFDYVFSGVRLGDDGLTHRALSGDVGAMELLADALYYESRHLREGVVHRVHESGALTQQVQSAGVQVAESSDMPMEIETEQSQQQLCEKTGLSQDAVIPIGKSRAGMERFVLLIPEIRKADVFLALADDSMGLAA
ncbi:MAG: hypothetical protein PHO55_08775 [Thiomonas arsenitoxydans]|nr:hypothetical protein [Thiomonas arsenitoxydans]